MDCSKLNEVFNIDGPNWIPDNPATSLWECQTREERKKKNREYYAKNIERYRERYADGGLERRQAYKERDGVREMLRKWDREYYAKNKERKNERRRELYVENREKILERNRAQYQKHKEKLQQRGREYYWNKKKAL